MGFGLAAEEILHFIHPQPKSQVVDG